MKLFIKNMVCNRCIMVVQSELEHAGYPPLKVQLGEAELKEELSADQREKLGSRMKVLGFEIIDDSRGKLIEKIKQTIIQLVHHSRENLRMNYSDYIASQLNRDYGYLSGLFSEVEGITIEKYIIQQKIEKVKELLVYNELTLSEIAYQMGYSSVAHLSGQFKKITGLTPSHFKQVKENKRKPIDLINE
jgi:YesN/AraC family two-component response regulator